MTAKEKKRKKLYGWRGPRSSFPLGLLGSLFIDHTRTQLEAQRWLVSGLDNQPKLSGNCEPLEMQPRATGGGLMVSKNGLCSGRHLRPWLAFA